jgi:hypothetical protein
MPLFGLGQGSTCGPLFWLLVYWLIVAEITIVSFVDDTGLGATSEYEDNP